MENNMKNKHFSLAGFFLLLVLCSCGKISESIRRDLILTGEPTSFNIPIITDTIGSIKFAEFKASTNMDNLIQTQTSDFTTANISSIRISQINFKLSDTSKVNNLSNFFSLGTRIIKDGRDTLTLASKGDISETISIEINLPIVNSTTDLKPYLSGANSSYIINGSLKHATSKVLKATMTPVYTVTLEK
jgi:hypothetical protein